MSRRCRSADHIPANVPTFIVNALDASRLTSSRTGIVSDAVTLELSEAGGHVGFIEGGPPWRPQYYVPRRIIEFLESHLIGVGTG